MIETKSGPQLVFIRSIAVFMDADGIRLTLGNKGSSGLEPCWLCQNVVRLQHFDLAETVHISNPDVTEHKTHTLESLRGIQRYLQSIPSRSAKEKAETLLGWNTEAMAETFLLQPALADLIGVDRVLYDPMHCFVANGLCNQEFGYWWEAVTTKTQSCASMRQPAGNMTDLRQKSVVPSQTSIGSEVKIIVETQVTLWWCYQFVPLSALKSSKMKKN